MVCFLFLCVLGGVNLDHKKKAWGLVGRFCWDMIANSPKKMRSISFTSVLLVRIFCCFSRVKWYVSRKKWCQNQSSKQDQIIPGTTLPEIDSSHLKIDGWKTMFSSLGQKAYFQGRTLSFRDPNTCLSICSFEFSCEITAWNAQENELVNLPFNFCLIFPINWRKNVPVESGSLIPRFMVRLYFGHTHTHTHGEGWWCNGYVCIWPTVTPSYPK